jgi:predicted membrane metal-binding protein
MLTTIALILAVLWLVGMIAGVAGGLIHFLLIAALIMLAYDLLAGHSRTHLR